MSDISIILTEQNVLGCCIKDNSCILKTDGKYFISSVGKDIFHSLKNIYLSDKPVNSRNILIEIERNSEESIIEKDIEPLFKLDVDPKDFLSYYKDLKKEWAKFDINSVVLPEVLRESSKRTDYDFNKFHELTERINKTISDVEDRPTHTYNPVEMFDTYVGTIHKRESLLNTYTTGCSILDSKLTERFSAGTITIVFGPSGVGKSTFVRYLVNKCINKQIPSIYYTLEMSFDATMDCIVAQRTGIPLKNFYPDVNGFIDHAIVDRIKKEKDKVQRIDTFRLKDDAVVSIDSLRAGIKEIRMQMNLPKNSNIIVFIDLLTMITNFNIGKGSKADKYEESMNTLHYLTREENIHIVGVVQARRPSDRVNITDRDQLDRFRPQIEELKNSAALEERSRIVLGVFRKVHFLQRYLPVQAEELSEVTDIMDISILKQNMGKLDKLRYVFEPESNKLGPFLEDGNYIEI